MKDINKFCVYKHIRLDTNEIFYVGIGKKSRPYSKHNRNKFWINIVNKHDYKIEILFENISQELAKEKEIQLIKFYGRIDLNTGILVNMTDGGEGKLNYKLPKASRDRIGIANSKRIISLQTREKISKAQKGLKKPDGFGEKVSQRCKGVSLKKETIEKLTGQKRSDETKQKNRIAALNRFINKENHPCTGKKRTQETKDKLRQANLGKKRTKNCKKDFYGQMAK